MEDLIRTYAIPAIVAILSAFAGWLGTQLKALYERKVNDSTKRAVVRTAVKAAEQLYQDLGGEEKLNKAVDGAREMLDEKGIAISNLELRQMIEAVVAEFNYHFAEGDEP